VERLSDEIDENLVQWEPSIKVDSIKIFIKGLRREIALNLSRRDIGEMEIDRIILRKAGKRLT